jgi:nucleoside-diphosphate-sugar epimerase
VTGTGRSARATSLPAGCACHPVHNDVVCRSLAAIHSALMRVFITGATGYIGGAVAKALRGAGHEVAALVRPGADTGALRDHGVVLVHGELESLPSMTTQLESYEVFVHTANSPTNTDAADSAAIEAFTSVRRYFVYTSGVWVLGNTDSADEGSDVNPLELAKWRAPHEELVLGAGGAVLRPGCVYGGRQSLLANWFAAAENNDPIRIVGDGRNRWAMVHLDELASLYLLAIERQVPGVLHGIDDSDSTLNECARAIAPNATIEHVPLADARAKLGPFADALAVDQRISSERTRLETAWNPWRTFTSSVEQQWKEWRESTASR